MYSNSTSAEAYNASFARFLKTVFNYMSGGVAISGLTAYIMFHTPAFLGFAMQYHLFLAIAWMASGFFIYNAIAKANVGAGLAMFIGYSIFTSVVLTPIAATYTMANITSAFFITAAIFACMSMFGLSTKKSLSGWGSFIKMSWYGVLAAIIINLIMHFAGAPIAGFSLIISFLVVPLVAAGVAYEMNMLKEQFFEFGAREETTSQMAIISATSLYTSFAVMFTHILNLIGFTNND